jgi:hypothetical protein
MEDWIGNARSGSESELATPPSAKGLSFDSKSRENAAAWSSLCSMSRGRDLPLSLEQQRVWAADHTSPSAANNTTVHLRLRGKLSRRALIATLERITTRHQVLRTTFRSIEDAPAQVIEPAGHSFSLTEQNVEGDWALERISRQEALDPFDLSSGPLIRGRLLCVSEQEYVLLITLHRIISDDWSIGVLLREMGALYRAFIRGEPDPLQPLKVL